MLLSNIVIGIVGYISTSLFVFDFNHFVDAIPWTTPFFMKAMITEGWELCAIIFILLFISVATYYLFFKMQDAIYLEEEKDNKM